jgi:hypothetical protein
MTMPRNNDLVHDNPRHGEFAYWALTQNIPAVKRTLDVYDSIIYTQMTEQTITNTTVETSMFNDIGCIGIRTIPANTFKTGNLLRARIGLDFTNTGNPTNTIKIKLGPYTLITSSGKLGASNTNIYAELLMDVLFKSAGPTGFIVAAGRTGMATSGGLSRTLLMSTPMTVDTTQNLTFDATYTWESASTSNICKTILSYIHLYN